MLKAENLQRTGAFKIRGAMNKIARLGDSAKSGVVTGSAGNHAQGLALAAKHFGINCEIYVPKGASLSKIAATKHHGATVIEGSDNVDTAIAAAKQRAAETGMTFVTLLMMQMLLRVREPLDLSSLRTLQTCLWSSFHLVVVDC